MPDDESEDGLPAEAHPRSRWEAKQALRHRVRTLRKTIPPEQAAAAARSVGELFDRHLAPHLSPGSVLAGYWPQGSELDIRPLLERLAEREVMIVLPAVIERDAPMLFRFWRPGDPLEKGNGCMHPPDGALVREPDFLLVPLLGFDDAFYRLGTGGGYYDRTLELLRRRRTVTAIGVGFAAQEIAALPRESFDQPLDGVLTEAYFRLR